MIKRVITLFGIILALVSTAQSCVAAVENRGQLIITGTVRVVGNEPFTHVVITNNKDKASGNSDTLITGPFTEELRRHYEGKTIVLEGTMCASPFPQFTRCFKATKIVE